MLPVDLQHQYFEHAAKEAERCKAKLLERARKLEEFRKIIEFREVPEDDSWKDWTIVAVDGSFSPSISERIGARFGVYQAGYMIFDGSDLREGKSESFRSDTLIDDQLGDPDTTRKILSLLSTRLEREVALSCLEREKPDLILIDGSFYGFRAGIGPLRSVELDIEGFDTVGDLADRVRDLSKRLLESEKAVGVIKRVRTSALDGYMLYKTADTNKCVDCNDKAISAAIMPVKSWFAYEWLLPSPYAFNYFSYFKTAYRHRAGEGRSMETVLVHAKNAVDRLLDSNLKCSFNDIKTSRYFIRCNDPMPPFCFETQPDTNVEPLIAYFQADHNPATGLPFPIDLVDQDISLPRGFTREFMEEILALLIRDKGMREIDISNYFMSINPQKEE